MTDQHSGYETKDVNILKVVLSGIVGTLILVIMLLYLMDYFTAAKEEMVYEAVLRPESVPLRELHARETEELHSYAVLDQQKGVYRIPIERAMKLMADEAYQKRLVKAKNR